MAGKPPHRVRSEQARAKQTGRARDTAAGRRVLDEQRPAIAALKAELVQRGLQVDDVQDDIANTTENVWSVVVRVSGERVTDEEADAVGAAILGQGRWRFTRQVKPL